MKYENLINYVKYTEAMIQPEEVAKITQGSVFLSKLPLSWQKAIAASGSQKMPYMGFVVDPYAFFLSYEITKPEVAEELLPPGYKLVPTAMFEGETPRFAAILGAFNVHTSVFWGTRLELYLIAENTKTGMMSWIIADYETNTNSFDPGKGSTRPSTSRCVVTTTFGGEMLVDVEGRLSRKQLVVTAGLNGGQRTRLEQRLWVEGNLSVDYGGEHGGDTQPFGLIFDPREMESAQRLKLSDVRVDRNDFGADFLAAKPFEAASFPFAQHFVTTSMPMGIGLRTAVDLENAVSRFSEASTRPSVGVALQAAAIF